MTPSGSIARIQRRVSLRDLTVLLAVVQTGSMGRAARQLATSQPAVSRSIADLEHALGVRLLDRSRQGVEPTPYGRALVARGLTILDELGQGIREIGFIADPTAGNLRVGASIAVAVGFLAPIIDRLSTKYPRLAFDVLSVDTADAFRALSVREVDLLVVHLSAPLIDEHMQADVLCEDPHVVVAAAHNPWVRRRRVRLADLMEESWVLPRPNAPYGTVVTEAFRASGLGLPRTIVTGTLPVRSMLLATGRYLSMIPKVVLSNPMSRQTLRALPVELPTTFRPLAVVTLKNRFLAPVAQTFIDSAHAAAALLGKDR
jgi:DNA-binding transcriptional LysR family regulator